MAYELQLDLSNAAYRRLLGVQDRFRERSPEDAIYRALGVLALLSDYIDPDTGVLTVVNPRPRTAEEQADPNVEIVFERLVPEHADATVAS